MVLEACGVLGGVIKYGGAAMTEEGLRENFAKDVALLRYVGIRVGGQALF